MPVYDLAEIHWEDYAEFDNPPEFVTPEEKKLQKLLSKFSNRSEETKDNNACLVKKCLSELCNIAKEYWLQIKVNLKSSRNLL